MPRKKGKAISFDAMVKFFMQNYDIPTKKDIDSLTARLDRIEIMVKSMCNGGTGQRVSGRSAARMARGGASMTALEQVLQVIKDYNQGVGVSEIKERTGFDDKKIRNIIFRLNKNKMIKRKSRGIYIAKNT